jgi:hypothetical protein
LLFIPPGYVYTMPLGHYLLQIVNIHCRWVRKASNPLHTSDLIVTTATFCYKTS